MWEAERRHSSDLPFLSLLVDLLEKEGLIADIHFQTSHLLLTLVSVTTVESSPVFSEMISSRD